MINKFIKLNTKLININYILYVDKVSGSEGYFAGLNEHSGKFGIFVQCKSFSSYAWFDSEKERDKEYDNITKTLI